MRRADAAGMFIQFAGHWTRRAVLRKVGCAACLVFVAGWLMGAQPSPDDFSGFMDFEYGDGYASDAYGPLAGNPQVGFDDERLDDFWPNHWSKTGTNSDHSTWKIGTDDKDNFGFFHAPRPGLMTSGHPDYDALEDGYVQVKLRNISMEGTPLEANGVPFDVTEQNDGWFYFRIRNVRSVWQDCMPSVPACQAIYWGLNLKDPDDPYSLGKANRWFESKMFDWNVYRPLYRLRYLDASGTSVPFATEKWQRAELAWPILTDTAHTEREPIFKLTASSEDINTCLEDIGCEFEVAMMLPYTFKDRHDFIFGPDDLGGVKAFCDDSDYCEVYSADYNLTPDTPEGLGLDFGGLHLLPYNDSLGTRESHPLIVVEFHPVVQQAKNIIFVTAGVHYEPDGMFVAEGLINELIRNVEEENATLLEGDLNGQLFLHYPVSFAIVFGADPDNLNWSVTHVVPYGDGAGDAAPAPGGHDWNYHSEGMGQCYDADEFPGEGFWNATRWMINKVDWFTEQRDNGWQESHCLLQYPDTWEWECSWWRLYSCSGSTPCPAPQPPWTQSDFPNECRINREFYARNDDPQALALRTYFRSLTDATVSRPVSLGIQVPVHLDLHGDSTPFHSRWTLPNSTNPMAPPPYIIWHYNDGIILHDPDFDTYIRPRIEDLSNNLRNPNLTNQPNPLAVYYREYCTCSEPPCSCKEDWNPPSPDALPSPGQPFENLDRHKLHFRPEVNYGTEQNPLKGPSFLDFDYLGDDFLGYWPGDAAEPPSSAIYPALQIVIEYDETALYRHYSEVTEEGEAYPFNPPPSGLRYDPPPECTVSVGDQHVGPSHQSELDYCVDGYIDDPDIYREWGRSLAWAFRDTFHYFDPIQVYFCDNDSDLHLSRKRTDTCIGENCELPQNCDVVPGDDCDDEDNSVYNNNPEICDGKDNDCNGKIDDGFENVPEVCDGVDNNCDGSTDEGFETVAEICDGVDNDCDGNVDEGMDDACVDADPCNGTEWCDGANGCQKEPDADNDGLPNADESLHGTDSTNPDTDGDSASDGAEVCSAGNGNCPDPLDPDSDNDTLLDGYEIQQRLNPCDPDSDDDGVNDNEDPLPLDPGVTPEYLEQVLRDQATYINSLNLSLFVGDTTAIKRSRRNMLASYSRQAANAIANANYNYATNRLNLLLIRIDGNWIAPEEDWMYDCNPMPPCEKSELAADVELQIDLIEYF